jgi:hypothetical protein
MDGAKRAGVGIAAAIAACSMGQAFAQAPSFAQAQGPLGFSGLWTMIPAKSHFAEGVTGPAPEAADLDVTKDDGAALAWTLVERDGLAVAASEFGDTPLNGQASNIVVGGVFAPVTVTRAGPHAVELVSRLGDGASQSIRLELHGSGVLTVDEKLVSPSGKTVTQHLEFVRAQR